MLKFAAHLIVFLVMTPRISSGFDFGFDLSEGQARSFGAFVAVPMPAVSGHWVTSALVSPWPEAVGFGLKSGVHIESSQFMWPLASHIQIWSDDFQTLNRRELDTLALFRIHSRVRFGIGAAVGEVPSGPYTMVKVSFWVVL